MPGVIENPFWKNVEGIGDEALYSGSSIADLLRQDLPGKESLAPDTQAFLNGLANASVEKEGLQDKLTAVHAFVQNALRQKINGTPVELSERMPSLLPLFDHVNRSMVSEYDGEGAMLSSYLLRYAGVNEEDITFVSANVCDNTRRHFWRFGIVVNDKEAGNHYLLDQTMGAPIVLKSNEGGLYSATGVSAVPPHEKQDIELDPVMLIPLAKGSPCFTGEKLRELAQTILPLLQNDLLGITDSTIEPDSDAPETP